MARFEFDLFEPEETVGKLWHAFASRLAPDTVHEGSAACLADLAPRLTVFFHGLGGAHDVEIQAAAAQVSDHRVTMRRRLAHFEERQIGASSDGAVLRLPPTIAHFPDAATNAALYFWLVAFASKAGEPVADADPLRRDLRSIALAHRTSARALADAPGLRPLHAHLSMEALALRPVKSMPREEAAVEAVIAHLLGGPLPTSPLARDMLAAATSDTMDLQAFAAPRSYRPFQPVPLWVELRSVAASSAAAADDAESAAATEEADNKVRRGRRRKSDLAERRDSLILHKFEAILSLADFVNLNRRVDDDDTQSARKALDDLNEITLGDVSNTPAARLKLHLDLSPADVARESLSGETRYPEWDHKAGAYMADHVRVLSSVAEALAEPPAPDAASSRRIRAVRRRFEALRPARVVVPRQVDGEELDLDEVVRTAADIRASGEGSDRLWRASRLKERDLAVTILLDASRSTEGSVGERSVIDIEREALAALAWGLHAVGDDCAIRAFSSLRRDRVFVLSVKDFAEPMSATIEARIAGLRPGFYTRLGAAVRHASAELAERARQRRLLLVITDGKPNDLDHYEGQHGIEDSRMAIREARRAGHAVFGIAVDAKSQSWFPRIFGRGGFTVLARPDRLTDALPGIYRHLTGG